MPVLSLLAGPKFVTTVHGTKKNKSAYLTGDAVIAVSQALTQGIPESKAHVVYNGVYPQPVLTAENKEKLLQSIQKDFAELDPSKKSCHVYWTSRTSKISVY